MQRSRNRPGSSTSISRRAASSSLAGAALGLMLGAHTRPAHADDGPVRVVVAGDCAFTGDVSRAIENDGYDPFSQLNGAFEKADIGFVNLESVLAAGEGSRRQFRPGAPILQGAESAAGALARGGVDVVSVANNHVFDLGSAGLSQSLAALRKVGIDTVGAGMSKDEALRASVRTVRGMKVAITAFTQFVNHAADNGAAAARTRDDMIAKVQELRAGADVVIVSLHWGEQFKQRALQDQTDMAHRLIDAGADAIVGHHPHVLQAVEVYRGRPILYSLGNFLWGRQVNPVEHSAFAEIEFRKVEPRVSRFRIFLVHRSPPLGLPRIVTGHEARFVRGTIVGTSLRFHTRMSEEQGALEVQLAPSP